jgi:hypothetical protein
MTAALPARVDEHHRGIGGGRRDSINAVRTATIRRTAS